MQLTGEFNQTEIESTTVYRYQIESTKPDRQPESEQ
jgi:hypothetical protein